MKPAPSPWKYLPLSHVIIDAEGDPIAHLECTHATADANVRLILEAPTLKNELENGSKFLEKLEQEMGIDTKPIRKQWRALQGRIFGVFQ